MPDTKLTTTEQFTKLTETLPGFLDAIRNPHTLQLAVMDRDDRPHYDKFCEGIIGCLNPATAIERQLAWAIASDYWRLNRVRSIEDGIFALSQANLTAEPGSAPNEKQIAQSVTHAFIAKQSDFKFLSQYEMRIQRMLNRNKAELKQLQAEHRKLVVAESDPATVFKANQQSGPIPTNTETKWDSSDNGFGFSEPPQPEPKRPSATTAATGQVTVIPFNPASRTGIAPNGFEFSKPATTQTGAMTLASLKAALRRAS